MIISKQKPRDIIKEYIKDDKKLFIIGCSECSKVCKVGGEDEVGEMKALLTEMGKEITGTAVPGPCCYALEVKKLYQSQKDAIESCDAILSLACGDGTQTIRNVVKKMVHPGVDTLFLGERVRGTVFKETCSLCGDCVLEDTGAICPITLCPKSLLNGPCGGSNKGKCEVDPDQDCAWILIYKSLQELGKVDKMKSIKQAKEYGKVRKPRTLDVTPQGVQKR